MTIYFLSTLFILGFGACFDVNKSRRRQAMYLAVCFGILILIAALRSREVGTDLAIHYARRYEQVALCSWAEVPAFSASTTYEIGYCYFTKLLSVINPSVQFYIAVTSAIIYGSIGVFLYRNSVDVEMSTLLLILSGTYYVYLTIIRQALAVAVLLLAYCVLTSRKPRLLRYLVFTGMVLLAASFHVASVVCLVFLVFDRLEFKKRDILLGVAAMILFTAAYQTFVILGMKLFGLTEDYSGYLTKAVESEGHINRQSIYMVLLVLVGFGLACYYMVLRPRNRMLRLCSPSQAAILKKQDSMLLFASLMASITRLMVFSMNAVNRLSYYFVPFLFLLYPRTVQEVSGKRSRRLLRVLIGVFMGIYFVWMTLRFEQKFHRTVPYRFFWQ